MLKNRPGVSIGNGSGWNFAKLRSLLWRRPLRIGKAGHRSDPGRRGVAGIVVHETTRPTLHSRIRTPRPRRILVAAPPSIVGWVRVNKHPSRSTPLHHKSLYAPKILPVTHQRDLAAHINP